MNLIKLCGARLRRVPHLAAIERGTLPARGWRGYVDARFAATGTFVPLLGAGIAAAEREELPLLARITDDNRRDELGMDPEGRVHPDEVHTLWVRECRDGVCSLLVEEGVTEAVLTAPGCVAEYDRAATQLIGKGGALVLGGAVAVKEWLIHEEYSLVARAMRGRFPGLTKRQRRYPEDHGNHDVHHAAWHLIVLAQLLEEQRTSRRDLELVLEGIIDMADISLTMADGLSEELEERDLLR